MEINLLFKILRFIMYFKIVKTTNFSHNNSKYKKGVAIMRVCFSDKEPILDKNSIFLAGPTKRNSNFELSWRKKAVEILKECNFNGVIYIPEFQSGKIKEEDLNRQMHWEWKCLDYAGVILFWVPRTIQTMPGFTTNVEFGIYTEKRPNNVVLGYPKYAEKMDYLKILYKEKTNKIPADTLRRTILNALEILGVNNEE